jgi:hypothetical protein
MPGQLAELLWVVAGSAVTLFAASLLASWTSQELRSRCTGRSPLAPKAPRADAPPGANQNAGGATQTSSNGAAGAHGERPLHASRSDPTSTH